MFNVSKTKYETNYWSPKGWSIPIRAYVNEVVVNHVFHALDMFPISNERAVVLVGDFGRPQHWIENLNNSLKRIRDPERIFVVEVPISTRIGKLRRESMVKEEANELLASSPAVTVDSNGEKLEISEVIELWKVTQFASKCFVNSKVYWISMIQERSGKGSHGGGRNPGQFGRDCGAGFEELKAEKPFFREYNTGRIVEIRVLLQKNSDGVVLEPILGDNNKTSIGFSPSVILTTDEFFKSIEGNVIRIKKGVGTAVPHKSDGSMGKRALAALGVEE